NTERPVTVSHGTNIVLGLDPDRLASIPDDLALPLRGGTPPLWDGHAGPRAADAVEELLGVREAGEVVTAAGIASRPQPL
ncbi:MAG TPA: hypothetical protein VIF36_00965, partial [Gaiellaceae bacterium]